MTKRRVVPSFFQCHPTHPLPVCHRLLSLHPNFQHSATQYEVCLLPDCLWAGKSWQSCRCLGDQPLSDFTFLGSRHLKEFGKRLWPSPQENAHTQAHSLQCQGVHRPTKPIHEVPWLSTHDPLQKRPRKPSQMAKILQPRTEGG